MTPRRAKPMVDREPHLGFAVLSSGTTCCPSVFKLACSDNSIGSDDLRIQHLVDRQKVVGVKSLRLIAVAAVPVSNSEPSGFTCFIPRLSSAPSNRRQKPPKPTYVPMLLTRIQPLHHAGEDTPKLPRLLDYRYQCDYGGCIAVRGVASRWVVWFLILFLHTRSVEGVRSRTGSTRQYGRAAATPQHSCGWLEHL